MSRNPQRALHAILNFCLCRGLSHRPVRKPNGNSFTSKTSNFVRVNTYPNRVRIPNTIIHEDVYSTPLSNPHPQQFNFTPTKHKQNSVTLQEGENSQYFTPDNNYHKQTSDVSSSSTEEYATPIGCLNMKTDIFTQKFNELQKSSSTSLIIEGSTDKSPVKTNFNFNNNLVNLSEKNRFSFDDKATKQRDVGVLRSKSEFEIPRKSPTLKNEKRFNGGFFKSDNLYALLTPILKRKNTMNGQSTPNKTSPTNSQFRIPGSPILKQLHSLPETRTTSLNSLRSGTADGDNNRLGVQVEPR